MQAAAPAKHRDGKIGGYLVGRRHTQGGIKAVNADTGQPLEVEADEVIITRKAVLSPQRHEFNGERLTNLEILSRINEKGGGVSLMEQGGKTGDHYRCPCSGNKYSYNGRELSDHEILDEMEKGGQACGCPHKFPHHLLPDRRESGGRIPDELNDLEKKIIARFQDDPRGYICLSGHEAEELDHLVQAGLIYSTGRTSAGCMDVFLTDAGRKAVRPLPYKAGGKTGDEQAPARTEIKKAGPSREFSFFKGIEHTYSNPFEINKAIEELLDSRPGDTGFSAQEKRFFKYYSGYGGLEKFGATGIGLLYEYFTPAEIAKRMWGLVYKHGYKGGSILEPSCGTGEFFNYAPDHAAKTGYEINSYSARITRILHPEVKVEQRHFEELFIKNRDTIRNKISGLPQFDLIIGNPPYGDFKGIFAGMGEKNYTKAHNFVDYFIFRGLDLLNSGGLLCFLIGVEVKAGGIPFLQQKMTPAKKEIALKANLLDAYRLPSDVFDRTEALTDIIVLQKK